MPNKMIYLTDELYNKLKFEENASKLIQRLLFEYFELNLTAEEKLQRAKAKINNESLSVEELEKQVKELNDKRQELVINENKKWDSDIQYILEKRKIRAEYEQYLKDHNLEFQKYSFEKWKMEHGKQELY